MQDYLGGVHPLFPPVFSSSLYHPLYHPCRTRCGSYISLAVAFFALCFLHLPSARGPPHPSHIVLLVFYRSGCFTFFLCDGFRHEPTSYNLITFPSQHQSHYNSESSFLFPPPPSSLHSPFTSTIATNKDVIVLSPPASTRRGPSPPAPSLSILCLFSVPLGLAFVVCISARVYRITYPMDPFVLCISRFSSRIPPLQSYRYTLLKLCFPLSLSLSSCV